VTVIARGSDAAAPQFGGKVRALAKLEGVARIPAWFALSPAAFVMSGNAGLEPDAFKISSEVRATLETALRELSPDGALVAVRSSASDEDGTAYSFAGQLESVLEVAHSAVPDAVLRVWRSGFSARLTEYRRAHRLGAPSAPAVLVQRMVRATVSGVAFSRDPVSGAKACVIAAVPGLGESLVSGERDGDTYRVQDGTVTTVATPEGNVLSETQALEVAALAARLEAHFGAPQDLEFAFEGDALYLLQSRPITTLKADGSSSSVSNNPVSSPEPSSETGEEIIWDNSNIIESYSGTTTPLTYSFARRAYTAVYRQFLVILGVDAGRIADNSNRLEAMIGLVRGRIYYNLSNWYRLLALLPGFKLNRALMEQMMGVNEALPDALEREIATGQAGVSRWRDAFDLTRAGVGLLLSWARLEPMKAAFYARLNQTLEPVPLETMDLSALVAHYRSLEGKLLTRWDAPLVNDFFAMIFYGVLRRIAQNWLSDRAGLQNALIVGGGGMVSAEPAARLEALAGLARGDAGLVDALCNGSLEQITRALEGHAELRSGAAAYLERFGDRCLDELKLESATLNDEPLLLWRSIGQLARLEGHTAHDAGATAKAAELEARDALPPLRRAVFNFVLAQARARVRDRENLRFERTRVFGRARRIFLEIGARLASSGAIDTPRDVFWLEVSDLIGYVEGTATTTDLRALVNARRQEFEGFKAQPAPPRRFTTRGPVRAGATLETRETTADAGLEHARSGIACSPGVVRGPVRVVLDPRTANLTEPVIIVAERTDPGWILILPLARALLVERGSLLSHSAIVSRELGIPAIVAIPGVTTWLKDGDWVELDGSSGVVKRVEPSA
jgi:pyruvate,water dikinase